MSVDGLDHLTLLAAMIVLAAIAAVRLSYRTGLPFLVLYVGLGVLIGPDVLRTSVHLEPHETARALGYAALVIILAEGGLGTRWSHIRDVRTVLAPAALLATVGVFVTAAVVASAAVALLGLSWAHALLLGAVLAPTDSAAVFAVLRQVPLPQRLSGLLEAESGGNDASAVVLVVALSTATHLDAGSLLTVGRHVVVELAIGLVIGLGAGAVGALSVGRVALPAAGLYPIAVLALCLLSYSSSALAHGSGFLSVYITAVVLGNARLPHRPPVRAFVEGLGWLAQIGLFVMLGLLVDLRALPSALLPALIIGVVLLLLARPAAVLVCVSPFRLPWREQVLIGWAGLRGAVPIVLALIPIVAGKPDAARLFHVVFMLVVVLTLLQSPSLPWVARRLGFINPSATTALDVETLPLMRLDAQLLTVSISAHSQLHGLEIFELRLPGAADVSLLIREGKVLVPTPYTSLRHGDEMLIVAPTEAVSATEHRLQQLTRHGRLGTWVRL